MRGRSPRQLRVAVILALAWLSPGVALAEEAKGRRPSCRAKCSGLGVDKVKAGDEHCGLVARKRKRAALEAACRLAEMKRQELQAEARERAENKCAHVAGREGCRCEGEVRRWENVYTNHLSQRCWAECGWFYQLECDREREPPPEAQNDGSAAER